MTPENIVDVLVQRGWRAEIVSSSAVVDFVDVDEAGLFLKKTYKVSLFFFYAIFRAKKK